MRHAVLALLLTGCIRHVPIGTDQLANLNGFGEAPEAAEAPETAPPAPPAQPEAAPAEGAPAEGTAPAEGAAPEPEVRTPARAAAPAPAAPEAPAPQPSGRQYTLTDRDGQVYPFSSDSQLYLVDEHGQRKGGAFKTLQIDVKTLTGELVDGTQVKANLDALDRAELDVKDVGTGVALGFGLVIALAAFIVVGAMAMNGLPQ